ncbi:exostosin family protein [Flavobacterium sp.]|uniref:exostosin domain-containing protein n=1 Tax=Flavobacterium sp. TaxID=239 RepID=UPI00260AAAEB|nr:exostosin family protein [Flavobacterium sp.]
MKIYIPHTDSFINNKKSFFILTRPFFKDGKWVDDSEEKEKWGLHSDFNLVDHMAQANFILIPFPINFYYINKKENLLKEIDTLCAKYNIKAYGYVSDDFGVAFPEFSNITYFRMSGFKSQLSQNNKGFLVPLSDHFQRIFQKEIITPVVKRELPVIGFCGHATTTRLKRFKELAKCLKENTRRFIQNPFRKDWETLFASAYERAILLKYFENCSLVITNFIYRNHYRAGAQTEIERTQTTIEYYNNIANSDYVLCVRGAGNFSVRFYETLMMGKIPVFVNTDCLLPFEDQINWKQHVVWIEWKDRKNIAQMVFDFHNQLSNEDFIQMQLNNRKLWKETLSVKGMLEMITNDI